MRRWCLLAACLFLLALWPDGRIGQRAALPAGGGAELVETNYVALTFDDGPRPGTTDRLLDGLRVRGASATFFLVGAEIPGREDLVRRIQTEGHQVGNHTWSHVRLEEDPAAALAEVQRTDTLLRQVLGEGEYWLRPPYGMVAEDVAAVMPVPMVKWSVDPRDWESRDAEKAAQAVLRDVGPGDIILFHDIYASSVDAALAVIDALQPQGYRFVTVEELLALNGVTPEAGGLYRNGRP